MSEKDIQKNVGTPEGFRNGKALSIFLKETFSITDAEGDKLLGYLKEHQYLLGGKDGVLYRGEQNKESDEVRWEPYAIEDVINDACDYNFDTILQVTQDLMDSEDPKEREQMSARLNRLCSDEVLLDKLFDRTKYGKEIEGLAHILAEELIRDMESKGGIDGAVKKMTDAIKRGEDLLPDVSPALKQNKGRSR